MELTPEQLARLVASKNALPKPEPARGLGDVIARLTKAVGIKPCAPCEVRRQQLNDFWRF